MLLAGCTGPGATNPPPDSTDTTDPWANLPVVGTDGTGTVDQRGGVIKLNDTIELQVPKGALPEGADLTIYIREVSYTPRQLTTTDSNFIDYYSSAVELLIDEMPYSEPLSLLVSINIESPRYLNFINQSLANDKVVDALVVDSRGTSHVIPISLIDSNIKLYFNLFDRESSLIFRATPNNYIHSKCTSAGGIFFADASTSFPFTINGYICKPPPGKVWDRVNMSLTSLDPTWSDTAEPAKLLTANLGNFWPIYNAKLSSDVVAQRIINNVNLLTPDILLLQELLDGEEQLPVMLPNVYEFVCPEYPSGDRYECIAWRTDKFTQTGDIKAITGESFPGEWAFEDADDSFSTDYCYKDDGDKDTGGVWTTLESNSLGISAFKVLSVHTATSGVEDSAYCREEQLLAFLKQLDIAKCTTCNTDSGNSDSPTRKWEKVDTTRAIVAGDFNIDPQHGGAGFPFSTTSDKERFRWVVDWTRSLGTKAKPEYDDDEGAINPDDLNALVALRTDTNYTTSYISANKSLDHVLVTGKVDEMGTSGDVSDDKLRSNLIDSATCFVLNGEDGRHALSEDWWASDNPDQSGMDHYAVGCKLGFHSATSTSFSLSLDSNNLSAQQGGSAQTTLTITPQNGFTGTVSLSLEKQDGSPVPSGITISPSSASVSGSSSVNQPLTIFVDSSVATDTYPLRIVGTSGSSSNYAEFSLTVSGGSGDGDGSDGTQWAWRSGPLYGIAYGDNTFVAVGGFGAIRTSPDGANWTTRSLGIGNSLSDVTFANGIFVAVGWNDTLLTSPDGVNWTKQTLGTDNGWLRAVTYGNGIFVAVGWNGTILTSPDGASWAAQSSGIGYGLESVVYADGTFVAVGGFGTILTSPDGIGWTVRGSRMGSDLFGVAYGDGTFVVLGSGGIIFSSRDSVSWALQYLGTGSKLSDATYANNTFVAVGRSGTILTSPDGASWTAQSSGIGYDLESIVYANGTFVAVGWSGTVLTSSDGVSWTAQSSGTDFNIYDVAYGNNTFVAVGQAGILLTSSDGASWTIQNSGTNIGGYWYTLIGVSYGNSSFVAVGQAGILLTSSDGASWTIQIPPIGDSFWDVTYASGTFVAVGSGGTIFTSP